MYDFLPFLERFVIPEHDRHFIHIENVYDFIKHFKCYIRSSDLFNYTENTFMALCIDDDYYVRYISSFISTNNEDFDFCIETIEKDVEELKIKKICIIEITVDLIPNEEFFSMLKKRINQVLIDYILFGNDNVYSHTNKEYISYDMNY